MAKLKKLEPVAFVLLFIVLYYALVVLAPDSALHDSTAETLAGGAAVVVAVALLVLRCLPKRRWSLERSIYAELGGRTADYFPLTNLPVDAGHQETAGFVGRLHSRLYQSQNRLQLQY
jgi:hypothetical protein